MTNTQTTPNPVDRTGWEQVYDLIVKMRTIVLAPVDVTGCQALSDATADKEKQRFQILIALILSPQTKDQVVGITMDKLKTTYNGCDIHALAGASIEEITEVIKGVSFHTNKAKYIKNTSAMILAEFKGVVPNTVKDLVKLSGVGPKVANLFKTTADNETTGIAVDTHLSRIFQRWKWTEETRPEKIAKDVERWLPPPLWRDVNQIVVGFGQTICSALRPACDICLARSVCPSSVSTKALIGDIEDIDLLRKLTKPARDKLVEEFGVPSEQCEWTVLSTNKTSFTKTATRW